jgi:protein TonB
VAPAAAAVLDPAAREGAIRDYADRLWARIVRQRPAGITARGIATVRFTLDADGALLTVAIADSSGQPMLDQAALEAVTHAAPFPAPPVRVFGNGPFSFTIPFQFR